MYGASTGKQINNELEQDAKAWGEALAMAIPLGIGALAYQLNHWAGYIAGIIAYLIEFYLIKVHQMERWDIWTVWLTSIYARDLRPGQFFTAPGLPARCKVLQILDDDGAQLILYHSPEVVGGVYDIPLRYRVQLLE